MRCITSALMAAALFANGCDVDVKDKGELPAVKVEGGRAPDVDVRGPDVDVKTKKKTVTVPAIDVTIPKQNDT